MTPETCIHGNPIADSCPACWEAVRLMQRGNAAVQEATSAALKRAGRKALPAAQRKVQRTVILHPATLAALTAMALPNEALGQTIDRIVTERVHDPDADHDYHRDQADADRPALPAIDEAF